MRNLSVVTEEKGKTRYRTKLRSWHWRGKRGKFRANGQSAAGQRRPVSVFGKVLDYSCFGGSVYPSWAYELASRLANASNRHMEWKNSPAVFALLTAKCRSISERDSQYNWMPKKGGMDK